MQAIFGTARPSGFVKYKEIRYIVIEKAEIVIYFYVRLC